MTAMTNLLNSIKSHILKKNDEQDIRDAQPPEWAPAPEISHTYGQYNEASDQEYRDGISYCLEHPLYPTSLIPSRFIDQIKSEGAKAWGLDLPQDQHRFSGRVDNIPPESKGQNLVHITTDKHCKDYCLLSNLPITAGLYDSSGREGVYYEVIIDKMNPPQSFLVIGTSCRPYPTFRLPGWNRESTGWHLDDLRKFFEDSDGGRNYTDNGHQLPLPWNPENRSEQYIPLGSTVGCGYIFKSGSIFFTYNGLRLPNAFNGAHLPRHERDVFAAIGVSGKTKFDVNFGGEPFRWVPGNTWQWRVEGLVGRLNSIGDECSERLELPAYSP
ncbi:endosome protein [Lentinula detonsa]|uniref:Endosome protein n=1 Tax=Lentinula detonsa TaxID=2804962 RepID=A0AA38UNH3_9AGAR|nr:endosome protein [Lentinula detonsa]